MALKFIDYDSSMGSITDAQFIAYCINKIGGTAEALDDTTASTEKSIISFTYKDLSDEGIPIYGSAKNTDPRRFWYDDNKNFLCLINKNDYNLIADNRISNTFRFLAHTQNNIPLPVLFRNTNNDANIKILNKAPYWTTQSSTNTTLKLCSNMYDYNKDMMHDNTVKLQQFCLGVVTYDDLYVSMGDWVNIGNKVTYDGKEYVCVIPGLFYKNS